MGEKTETDDQQAADQRNYLAEAVERINKKLEQAGRRIRHIPPGESERYIATFPISNSTPRPSTHAQTDKSSEKKDGTDGSDR
jgi:uncharacterized FlaG/YvyC family protein